MIPTPKEIRELSIPNPYTEGKFYPIPGYPKLEAKVTRGRGRNAGKSYVTVRKPCRVNVVSCIDGEILSTHDDYNTGRAEYPDGEWEWV